MKNFRCLLIALAFLHYVRVLINILFYLLLLVNNTFILNNISFIFTFGHIKDFFKPYIKL
ncbi:MAG: hypothetical protein A2W91_08970 [Bacteroidetes bacterium GWF2_38_335]|nr:MAG: hypothetical protein A2W91_08970 [Bacteroidetes bacterium GWF2_38_335]OFY80504.1 MAG: hypothetical protein A2281_08695 [Bacteroidetes bacterium RIFOXYA12_FULL_38_20]HBS85887.1 hypothetical protein [Bacteroidales bacterium]